MLSRVIWGHAPRCSSRSARSRSACSSAGPRPGRRLQRRQDRHRPQRLFNIFLAFPQLVLALTLVSVLAPCKPSGGAVSGQWAHRIIVVMLALGIVSVPLLGRITRASAISWSQREFVIAARAQGATNRRIMFREVLPNVLPAMFSIALLASRSCSCRRALAILGVGVRSPTRRGAT